MSRGKIDTPSLLVEVAAAQRKIIIRRIDGIWHAGLPKYHGGRGMARQYSGWTEAMKEVGRNV